MRKTKMNRVTKAFEDEIAVLISMGLVQYLIDEEGNFCYELTEEGYKVNNGETTFDDYEKRKINGPEKIPT